MGWPDLVLVEGLDPLDGSLEGLTKSRIEIDHRLVEILVSYPEAVEINPVKAGCQAVQGLVTFGSDLVDQIADNVSRLIASNDGAWQILGGRPRAPTEGETIQHTISWSFGCSVDSSLDGSVDAGPPGGDYQHRRLPVGELNPPPERQGPLALDGSALGSISATLDELVDRIGILADAADAEDEALVELREVERQLQTAGRRLAKIVRRLS